MEEETIISLIITMLPMAGGIIISIKKWIGKNTKIQNIKVLLQSVDDALRDDKITESEFRIIYGNYKTLVNSE